MKFIAKNLGIAVLTFLFSTSEGLAQSVWSLSPVIPNGFGVNIHFMDPKPGELEMMNEAGIRWIRMDFVWRKTELQKGQYDFSAYDQLMGKLDQHKIRALFILDYANPLYDQGLAPYTEEGRQAFAAWAVEAVRHFQGRGIIWELWNEPNLKTFWRPKPNANDYAKLAIAVGQALQNAHLKEIYIGPATGFIDIAFLETCFKVGVLKYWSAVSVHPYRYLVPETATREFNYLQQIISKYKPVDRVIPIISSEWGYSAFDYQLTPENMNLYSKKPQINEVNPSKFIIRQWLNNLINRIPLSIWYDWRNDGTDPLNREHNFGLVRYPYNTNAMPVYEAKSTYFAVKTLNKILGGYQLQDRLNAGTSEDYILTFKKDQEIRLAAWTVFSPQRKLFIPNYLGRFQVFNYLGKNQGIIDSNGKGLNISLTDAPQYLIPDEQEIKK